MHERPTEYEIMYTYTPYYIYIYKWSFQYVFKELKSFNSQLTSSDLAKKPHDYRHVSQRDSGMLQIDTKASASTHFVK